ncbi:hypothetical protein BC826DRAFT_114407 [Russula brevipes]|nr:hypothetical protein BC826DRAFT_114407 [Russula brevipes]
MLKHIDRWFAFARQLRLGIDNMEDIILVTGCDRTRSWTNVAFLGSQYDAQASFGVRVVDSLIQFSHGRVEGAVLRQEPEGMDLPENQCIFVRGFRVARRALRIWPRQLRAEGGCAPGPGGYDREPGRELVSISAITQYRDPLHLLLNYVAERAPDCEMILVHDDDLGMIDGMGDSASLETLQPGKVVDLLGTSNLTIYKFRFGLSPASHPNTDAGVLTVATLSKIFRNWGGLHVL